MTIQTARLELVPATSELVRQEIEDRDALGVSLNATIPFDWPPEEVRDVLPIFLARLEEREQLDPALDAVRWGTYYWVSRAESGEERLLIGSGGFMGSPDATGIVEIGYGTHAAYRRLGYATEAVRALAEFAARQPEVQHVVADALPENIGSVGVLARSGFVEVGPGAEAGTRRFEYRG
jgi:ribosomal-protein-alanine N-acetyltransferase